MLLNRNTLIPVLAALAGLLIGGGLSSVFLVKKSSESYELQHRLSVYERVRLLHQLRANDNTNAIAEQEILLDGDIVGLGFYVEQKKNRDSGSMNALQKAAKYRKEFHSPISNPEADRALSHALSLAPQ